MTTDDCFNDDLLVAYAKGRGNPNDNARIESHLEECRRCCTRVDELTFGSSFLAHVRNAATNEPVNDDAVQTEDSNHYESDHGLLTLPEISGYHIRREIGRGGMGVVFEAIQTKLNRPVALKVLPPSMARFSSTAVQRFRAEASAAARLHHNNIIPIYDFGESDGAYYYAMELIEGATLQRVIQSLSKGAPTSSIPIQLSRLFGTPSSNREPQSASSDEGKRDVQRSNYDTGFSSGSATGRAYYRQVARWMGDVADALHLAHSKGIIHRDIKPSNLILASDGRLMVADFGLAKCTDTESVTVTGSLVGTWRYMSPEQALAKRMPVDHRTDIYSLAATMYELLTFVHAFPGTDEKEIISKVIMHDPVWPRKLVRSVPAELETICMKAMEKSRDDRYADAASFAEELRRYLNDIPIVAKPPGPIVRAKKYVKRHRSALSLVVALVMVVAGAIAIVDAQSANKRRILDEISSRITSGNEFYEREDWPAAERCFLDVLELDPNNIEAMGNLARTRKELYNSIKDPDSTLFEELNKLCDKTLALDTNREYYSDLLNIKGVMLKKLLRYDEAIEVYHLAQQFDVTRPGPVINLGMMCALKENLDESRKWYERALAMYSDPSAYNEGACVYLHQNLGALLLYEQDQSAIQHVAISRECEPDNVPTLILNAKLCLTFDACDLVESAVDVAKIADHEARGKSARAKRILALALLSIGDFKGAKREAQSAQDLQDMAVPNELILALADAELGEREAAKMHLENADMGWPEDLRNPGDIVVQAPNGLLWFESANELLELRAEVQALLNNKNH